MGEKDAAEKTLLDYADVFADIWNVLMFHGERIMKESDLADALPRSIYKADGKLHEQERDVAKFWMRTQLRISLVGVENQSKAEAGMPLRVIGYDGAAYRAQLNADKPYEPNVRYPVVTIVLYFGFEMHWNKERRLKECFDIPAALEPYVNDYPIHVIEVAWLPDDVIAQFTSDFKLVADFFGHLRKKDDYDPPEDEIRHVNEILELLSVMSGDSRPLEGKENGKKGERETMRLAMLDKIEARGEARGKEEGKREGKKEGILLGTRNAVVNTIRNLMASQKWTAVEAMEAMGIPVAERAAYEALL